ncbi:Cyclin-dependent kinase inhibitor [Rhynchospora pubera]|uniref:Cyclin-dependent kinase inhibitor n=1 Tax=Rhynchospora pubera TaxID=906938 RepID=A0AAV8GB16_9POAL|nr:Cyclin-dependent kinase inhibitor [Rhynchospora pubera]
MGRITSKRNNRGGGTGVLTRGQSLALYGVSTTSSYLDLRSRRLEKKLVVSKKKQRGYEKRNPSSAKKSVGSRNRSEERDPLSGMEGGAEENNEKLQGPFGDNETASREARESTPCCLIRDSNKSLTPSSSNNCSAKPTTHQTGGHTSQRVIPSEREINDLFGKPEELQQKNFTEKYNFDPVTEQPLPGRFEWEKLDPPK